ncbi:MAG: tetratricopeptide repeat protein [Calditrichaceae bacterium]
MRVILFILFSMMIIISGCSKAEQPDLPADAKLNLANAYYTNGLYEAAVQEYLDYLENYQVDPNRRANTYYTIGDIYFERLNDYQKALTYYFKIKYLYPESALQGEIGKKIVNCLERLNKSTDALRVVEQEAALDKESVKEHLPGKVVAEIGSRKITQGDLDHEISKLPVYVQEQFNDPKQKQEYLKQYILQELLYDKAKRQQLDKDKDVIEGTFRAQKALMAEKILKAEMKDKVKIDPSDVELFYMAHKDRYAEKNDKGEVIRQKPFNEVQQQVANDLALDRQQKAYQQLLGQLMKAEDVKIYEDRVQ